MFVKRRSQEAAQVPTGSSADTSNGQGSRHGRASTYEAGSSRDIYIPLNPHQPFEGVTYRARLRLPPEELPPGQPTGVVGAPRPRIRGAVGSDQIYRDYYAMLEVGRQATEEELTRAFRRYVSRMHPDKFQGEPREQMLAQQALKVMLAGIRMLHDPRLRAQYDALLGKMSPLGARLDQNHSIVEHADQSL